MTGGGGQDVPWPHLLGDDPAFTSERPLHVVYIGGANPAAHAMFQDAARYAPPQECQPAVKGVRCWWKRAGANVVVELFKEETLREILEEPLEEPLDNIWNVSRRKPNLLAGGRFDERSARIVGRQG